jgi:hypothetical protein
MSGHDIAIITMNTPFPLGIGTGINSIPLSSAAPQVGSVPYTAGYGIVGVQPNTPSTQVKYVFIVSVCSSCFCSK